MKKILILALFAGCAASDPLDPNQNNENNENNENNTQQCATPPCSTDNTGCVDNDGDGFGLGCQRGIDCDDGNSARAPDRAEACDEIDNDCNGEIDDGIDCGNCTDNDQDGYGEGCTPGPDCDDTDDTVNEGAAERCDEADNDCDNEEDEDFANELGSPCTVGQGVCEATGTVVCSGDQLSTACDAVAGNPSTEVCDNLDNDCDGQIDNGLNCNGCTEDPNEPNDRSTMATPVAAGGSATGRLCGDNVDWFGLGSVTAGQTVNVTVEFSHAAGDIELELYIGDTFEDASRSGTDNETLATTASKSGTATARLIFGRTPPATGTPYTIRRP